MTITLDDLRGDFVDGDDDIVRAIDGCLLAYQPQGKEQSDEYYRDLNEIFNLLTQRPIPFAVMLATYLLAIKRLIIRSDRVPGFGEFVDNREIQNYINKHQFMFEGAEEWLTKARLFFIARDHGIPAAMLYKLSDGAIDPREVQG